MKKLIGLVIILTALILGSFYCMGFITERVIKRNLETASKTKGLTVTIAEYNRGWFSSSVVLNWQMTVPNQLNPSLKGLSPTYNEKIPLTIYHGPIIFSPEATKFGLGYAATELPLSQNYSTYLDENFTNTSIKPRFNISLFVNYFAESKLEIKIPQFKLISKKGEEFDWTGLVSSTTVNRVGDKIQGEIVFQGLTFAENQKKAVVSQTTSNYDLKITQDLYLGNASLLLPSFTVTDQGKSVFELENFYIKTENDSPNGLVNSALNVSVDKIIVNDKKFGPGKINIRLKNLDATILAQINRQTRLSNPNAPLQQEQDLLAILPEIPKLLRHGAEFEISNLSFTMPQGTIEGNLVLSLPKGEENPFVLLQKAQGKGKLRLPKEIIRLMLIETNKNKLQEQAKTPAQNQEPPSSSAAPSLPPQAPPTATVNIEQQASTLADNQMNEMVKTGLVVPDGNDYIIEVLLNNGKLQINGQPFNSNMIRF